MSGLWSFKKAKAPSAEAPSFFDVMKCDIFDRLDEPHKCDDELQNKIEEVYQSHGKDGGSASNDTLFKEIRSGGSEAYTFLQTALSQPAQPKQPKTSIVSKTAEKFENQDREFSHPTSSSVPRAVKINTLPPVYDEGPIIKQHAEWSQKYHQKRRIPLAPCNTNVSRAPKAKVCAAKQMASVDAERTVAAEVKEWKELHQCRSAAAAALAEKERLEQELVHMKQQEDRRRNEELAKQQKRHGEMVEQHCRMRGKLLLQHAFSIWRAKASEEAARRLRATSQLQVVWTFRILNRCFKGWRLWSASEQSLRRQRREEAENIQEEATAALAAKFLRQQLLARFMFRWIAAWHTHERHRRLALERHALQGRISTALGKAQKQATASDLPCASPSPGFPTPRPAHPSLGLGCRPPPATTPTPTPKRRPASLPPPGPVSTPRPRGTPLVAMPPPLPTPRPSAVGPRPGSAGTGTPLRRLQTAADAAFLTRLEQRTEIRKQRWSALQQRYEDGRRRKQEQELELQLHIIELAEQQQRQLLEEQKLDALLRQQHNLLLLRRHDRARQAEAVATQHYQRHILRVWQPWTRLLAMRRQAEVCAGQHARLSLMRRYVLQWQEYVVVEHKVRQIVFIFRVVTLTQYIRFAVKRMAFGKLRMHAESMRFRRRLAETEDERRVLRAGWRWWGAAGAARCRARAEAERRRCTELQALLAQADLHPRFLLRECFQRWQRAQHRAEDQRLREAFRQQAWQNVRGWLGR